jgi:hypothetical protein
MSAAIARCLKLARADDTGSGYVFSTPRGHVTRYDTDGLPEHGNALRHAYRSLAKVLEVDDVIVRLLMGHSLRGISEGYISRDMVRLKLRQEQQRISRRIVELLGTKL